MGRKLASVQLINKIKPIENADNLEIAEVLGWNCVVQKGLFKENQMIVYIETDSFLPIKPEFEFLRKSCYKKMHTGEEGFKIRTIKLRGVFSSGLVFPMTILTNQIEVYKIGDDVTLDLGIIQWQQYVPPELYGKMKGSFPSFLIKTDETRVQVLQEMLTKYKGTKCYYTEKIDGTSVTYYIKDGIFGVCGRNIEYQVDDTNTYCEIARKYNIKEKLLAMNCNIAIQGEIFGMGLQGNPLKMRDVQVRFFNVFDIDKFEYFEFERFLTTMNFLGLNPVPILDTNFILTDDIDELVKLAIRKSTINSNSWAEGIVIRPLIEKIDLKMAQGFGNGRVSFKVINVEYLLVNDN